MVRVFQALAILLGVVAAPAAQARQTVLFGMDRQGILHFLPASLCAYPGQELRLAADVLDASGRRMYFPVESFTWRLTRTNGLWDQWDAASGSGYGPFRRGYDLPGSVYTWIHYDVGAYGRLEAGARGYLSTSVQVVDPRANPSVRCEWTHPDVYVGTVPPPQPPVPPTPPQPPTPPGPPIPVPPTDTYRCFDRCVVGAKCTDGCPYGGRCRYIPASYPYWRVISCF